MKKTRTRLFISHTLIISIITAALLISSGIDFINGPHGWGDTVGIILCVAAIATLPTLIFFPWFYTVSKEGIGIFYIVGGRLFYPKDKITAVELEYGGIGRWGYEIPLIFDTLVIKGTPRGKRFFFTDSALPRTAGLIRAIENAGYDIDGAVLTEGCEAARRLMRRAGTFASEKQDSGEAQAEERRLRSIVREGTENADEYKYAYLYKGKLALSQRPKRSYEYCIVKDGRYLPIMRVKVRGGVHIPKPLFYTADEIRAVLCE